MKTYRIGGYLLQFNFIFNDYFEERILKYAVTTNEEPDFIIENKIVDDLIIPKGEIIFDQEGKRVIKTEIGQAILFYNNESLETIAYHDEEYKYVHLEFSRGIYEQIARLEYIMTGFIFASMMASKGIITLHASAISYQGQGLLFSAASTTGKSTHTGLWKKYKQDVIIINDDKPLIKINSDESITVLGSPWSGKTALNENIEVPLNSICFLSQAKTNSISEVSSQESLLLLLQNIHRPTTRKHYELVINNLEKVVNNIPMYQLRCNISSDAVDTVYKKIFKEKSNEN